MTLVGLDLNSSRARAVQGPLGDFALTLPLDPPAQELPMVVSLAASRPEVGLQGVRLLRQLPHLTCHGFLAHLAANGAAPRWQAGRHKLDPEQALTLVWQRLAPPCKKAEGVVVSLPGYLSRAQADLVRGLGEKNKVKLLGSLPVLVAAALAGYAEQSWIGSALVLDIDDHALSLGLVRAVEGQAHLLEMRHFTSLGLRVWKDRLINALADCCVLQSRRDPRDVPQAEQGLYEQLDTLLDAGLHGRMIQLGIQGGQWYQNLLVHPEETAAFCAGLLRQVVQEIEVFFGNLAPEEVPASILMTAAVGRLPGLAHRLRVFMEEAARQPQECGSRPRTALEDFGEGLVQDASGALAGVVILAADAPARAAHGVGAHFQRGDLPRGHLDLVAPLPLPQPMEAGPPRLHFQGQDYFLSDPSFTVGSMIGCHLIFDPNRHPNVAPRHCEIIFDHRTYLLFNRSRDGTLVNDNSVIGSVVLHAGDWIRLGTQGPLLRFLGQAGSRTLTA